MDGPYLDRVRMSIHAEVHYALLLDRRVVVLPNALPELRGPLLLELDEGVVRSPSPIGQGLAHPQVIETHVHQIDDLRSRVKGQRKQ